MLRAIKAKINGGDAQLVHVHHVTGTNPSLTDRIAYCSQKPGTVGWTAPLPDDTKVTCIICSGSPLVQD